MNGITCGFIGLGLIGGSIAKALKASVPNCKIIAADPGEAALKLALTEGIVDVALPEADEHFKECDYLFLCAPVSFNARNMELVKPFLSPSCTLTDVGSVKTQIHLHAKRLGLSSQFVGGHPMTGSERIGYPNSAALLLQNAYYILTPSEDADKERVEAYRSLVEQIGAIPLVLPYEQHDLVTAGISHLPHIVAACLVNLVRDEDNADGIMKLIAAGGFKDITRIASSSPVMWQQICMTNGENILHMLSAYIEALTCAKRSIEKKDPDALYALFDEARTYRESFINSSSGPIKRLYSLTVDISDRPGEIATVATLLAQNDISIKNIGINHNREAAEGTMRIEFYGEDAVAKAGRILTENGYKTKERTL